jgi:hypothetical protein
MESLGDNWERSAFEGRTFLAGSSLMNGQEIEYVSAQMIALVGGGNGRQKSSQANAVDPDGNG